MNNRDDIINSVIERIGTTLNSDELIIGVPIQREGGGITVAKFAAKAIYTPKANEVLIPIIDKTLTEMGIIKPESEPEDNKGESNE